MCDYVIMTDSCCDLSDQMAREMGIEILPLSLSLNGTSYRNYPDGREIGFQEFYNHLRKGEISTTAAVSVGQFEEAMRGILQTGRDILCLSFSSALSTTYQSAVIAAQTMAEEFPQNRVLTVDTLCASMGQGLLVYLCAKEQQAGGTLEEVCAFAQKTRGRMGQWFTVEDLNHLRRGGRVSATSAFFGTMLSIKPIIRINEKGELIPEMKVRGRKASLLKLVELMEKSQDPAAKEVFISHGDCLEDARFVADEVVRRMGEKEITINYAGPVIGSHTGPGVVTLFYRRAGES